MVNSLHWSDSVNKVMPNKNTAWDIPCGHYYFLLVQGNTSEFSLICHVPVSKIFQWVWKFTIQYGIAVYLLSLNTTLCVFDHHTFILQGNYNQWSISLVTTKCNRMSIIFNDIWKYFPSVCVAINHPKWGIVGIFTMGRYQKLAIPNIVKWTKIFQTIPWKESFLQNK